MGIFGRSTGNARNRSRKAADGSLRPCPSSPNCVCSDDPRPSHHVEPLRLAAPAAEAWAAAATEIGAWPRTRIVSRSGERLHAECRSALFGFVDDVELVLRAKLGEIAVRSASRVGFGDLGVNRRRVEALRAALVRRGVVAPAKR